MTTKRLVAVLLSVLAFSGLPACSSQTNESINYRRMISVAGFELTREEYANGATGVYVGPATADIVDSVSGPGLVLSVEPDGYSDGSFKYVAEGKGHADDTGDCSVWLHRLESPSAEYAGGDRLTPSQRAGVMDGSLVVLRVDVLCDAQADHWDS